MPKSSKSISPAFIFWTRTRLAVLRFSMLLARSANKSLSDSPDKNLTSSLAILLGKLPLFIAYDILGHQIYKSDAIGVPSVLLRKGPLYLRLPLILGPLGVND